MAPPVCDYCQASNDDEREDNAVCEACMVQTEGRKTTACRWDDSEHRWVEFVRVAVFFSVSQGQTRHGLMHGHALGPASAMGTEQARRTMKVPKVWQPFMVAWLLKGRLCARATMVDGTHTLTEALP